MVFTNPVFCAIDTQDAVAASRLCCELRPHIGGVKLGLEFFTANGQEGVNMVTDNGAIPLFLDLKFHDIPNTVGAAVRSVMKLKPKMMTIHAGGGKAMMQAAAKAAEDEAARLNIEKPLILGVTILTSLSGEETEEIGFSDPIATQVERLALLAQSSGLDGIVCSSHEIEAVRQACGPDFNLIVPGIRPAGAATQDQKRVMTPEEALNKGATYLVIGRPITQSKDPVSTAANIADTLRCVNMTKTA